MLIRRHPIDITQLIPDRKKDAHKGSCGRLLIIAGSCRYTGAAALMVEAALRSGVGVVYAIATQAVAQVIRNRTPEVVVIEVASMEGKFDKNILDDMRGAIEEYRIDAIGVGPGIGWLDHFDAFYEGLLDIIKKHQLKALVDADALAPIYQKIIGQSMLPNHLIFTPHPKEFLRMTALESVNEINKDVLHAAKKVKQVIVYKTNATVVANDEGVWRSGTGNESLATAGSGDVLSGIIAGFLAQGIQLVDAAKLGVYMHGLVAELASRDFGRHSLIASDLCNYIPKGFQELSQYHG